MVSHPMSIPDPTQPRAHVQDHADRGLYLMHKMCDEVIHTPPGNQIESGQAARVGHAGRGGCGPLSRVFDSSPEGVCYSLK